jgi:hypothetical protein
MPLSPATADRSPPQETITNLLAPVVKLRRPDHDAAVVMDNRETTGLASGIDLEPQGVWLRIKHSALEDDSEGVAAEDGRLTRREQPTRSRRMARRQWALPAVKHKHMRHEINVSFRTLRLRG